MTEADFQREATQLFREMGLDLPADTLSFFEDTDTAEKTNWKAGLKVPSPPRARRTYSSETAHAHKRQQQGIERHRNGSSSLKRPSTHERSPTSIRKVNSVKERSKRSEASERFGYKGPLRTKDQPTGHSNYQLGRDPVTNAASGGEKPNVRPIHRIPAPKAATKKVPNTNSANIPSSIAYPADSVPSQTSSLRKQPAVVSASQPATVQNAGANVSTQNGFHVTPYSQVDGNLLSKSTVPSSNGHTELQRRRSSPEKLPGNSASNEPQSNTQVIYSRKSSFQVLSLTNSSQRIMHTRHDGGSSKRHHSIDQSARPLIQSRIPAPPRLHNEKKNYAGSSARKSVPLFTTHSPPPQEESAVYDRLSAPTSPTSDEQPPPLPQKHTTKIPQPQLSGPQLHQGHQMKRDASQLSGIYDRLSPLEIAEITKAAAEETTLESKESGKTQNRSVSRNPSSASNVSSSSETTSEQERRESNHLKTKKHHRTHSAEGVGNGRNRRKLSPDNPTHSLRVQSHSRRRSDENTHLVSKIGSSTSSSRSSNSRDPRSPERSTESSDLDRNITSPSSISTLSSPEPPRPDTQTPDSDERRARLDINWSKQSLDRNMSAVASSTVAALSSLVEVVSTPVKSDSGFQYNNSNGTGVPPWYIDMDESGSTNSSVPISPVSSPVSPLPPPPSSSGQTGSVSSQTSSQSNTSGNANGIQSIASNSKHRSPRSSTGEQTVSARKSSKTENNITMNGLVNGSDTVHGGVLSSSSKTSLMSQGSNTSHGSRSSQDSQSHKSRVVGPPLHDYAIIEPPDHDYAVLDPEADRDFFGYCAGCKRPVIGVNSGCMALGRIYHLKCFTCSKCAKQLSSQNFYTQGKDILCEKDFTATLKRCRTCNQRIHDRVLEAFGLAYHPTCFRCNVCNICLDGIPYTSDSSQRVYCIQDYHRKFAPKCAACNKPIIPQPGKAKSLRVIAMEKSYHVQCYRCVDCNKQLASTKGGGEKCYPLDDLLLCKDCNTNRVMFNYM